jgi:hypothetical protein
LLKVYQLHNHIDISVAVLVEFNAQGWKGMKAITILQPFASLIACGVKQIETRSWATKFRGPIAIHAGRGYGPLDITTTDAVQGVFFNTDYIKLFPDSLPRGAVIAIADLMDCVVMTDNLIAQQYGTIQGHNELTSGWWEPGRYAWILANVRRIEPVPAKGKQRLWEWKGPSGD